MPRLRDRIVARIAAAPPRAVLLAAWLAAVAYGFPGYLMTDSIDQLYQVRTGHYGDWHPPLMARLWSLVEHVATGPIGLLLLQLGVLTIAIDALLRRRLAPGPAACATACLVLFPPVLAPMAVVWKDALMAAFLAAGAVFVTAPRLGRRELALAAACLFLVAGLRHNAVLAIVPLTIAAAHRLLGTRPRAIAAGIAAAALLWGAAFATDRALADEADHPWHRTVAMLDLAGTIRFAGPLTDDELRDELAGVPLHATHDLQAHARAARNRWQWWYTTTGDDRLFDPPTTEAERDAVAAAWWRMVTDHPLAWLGHRARLFAITLGLGEAEPLGPVFHEFMTLDEQRANLHFDATRSSVQVALGDLFDALARTPLFRPVLYLLLAIVVLARPGWRRGHVALVASGLCYEAGLFVAAPSTDFRYSHWMILSALIAAAGAAASAIPAWRRTDDAVSSPP